MRTVKSDVERISALNREDRIMRVFACTAILSLATFALVFAGATVDRSVVSVLGQPGTGGGCSAVCKVGASGTGGEKSGGNAQGFLRKGPGESVPGTTIQNSGTNFSGHLVVSGTENGTFSGADAPGVGIVGHTTGDFGECSGRCG